jgi:cytidylate kinase
MVIAIDGPAGAGKSSVARSLAVRLSYSYLDSGALYRAVGLLALRVPDAEPGELAERARIELPAGTGDAPPRVLLDGEDVSALLRSPQVSDAASRAAADGRVRDALLGTQRALLATGDWVAEGRDIGTVVAPGAQLKVFLTASPRTRAERRAAELGGDVEAVLAEQVQRDARDESREHSPLRAAQGALVLDTDGLTIEEAVERIAALVQGPGG